MTVAAIALATSPPAAPPMPSATTSTGWAAIMSRSASLPCSVVAGRARSAIKK